MEDFANILQRDYGLKPQGKAGPIGGTRGNGSGSGGENGSRKEGGMARAGRNGSVRGSVLDQDSDELFGDDIFGLGSNGNVKPPGGRSDATLDPFGLSSGYDDVFGGPPKYSSPTFASMSNHDDIFRVGTKPQPAMLKNANSPLFDTPVYDDDIFGGVPGIRSSAGVFDDVFSGGTAAPSVSLFDDLLGGYSAGERKESRTPRGSSPARPSAPEERDSIFEDLLSGVSSVESSKPRWSADAKPRQHPDSRGPVDRASTAEDAPSFVDPIISIMKQTSFPWMDESQEGVSEDIDDRTPARNDAGLDENLEHYQAPNDSYFPKSVKESRQKDIGSSMLDSSMKDRFGPPDASSNSDSPSVLLEADTLEAAFLQHLPRRESDIRGPTSNLGFTEGYGFPSFETNVDPSSVQLETEMGQAGGDEWLTIDEVKLATAPSTMPPPSRQAPFLPNERQSFSFQTYFQREQNIPDYKSESSSQGSPEDLPFYRQSGSSTFAQGVQNDVMAAAAARGIDGLEDFVSSVLNKSETSSWPQEEVDGATEGGGYQGEVKDPMNRGEVKLRLAKEAREKDREDKKKEAKVARAAAREKEGKEAREQILREAKEKQAREREKQEKERLAKEEKEREKQRKERVREREREREKDRAAERAAVERATAEARDRALTEARERAERAVVERATAEARERAAAEAKERAERAAVERAAAEARERAAAEAKERAERAAVERAAAEARERAAAEAKERAERAAADKAAAEARERAERAAVERATSEARERASAEARARAAAESRARAERAATESVAAEVRERAAERAAAEARERAERATAEKAREQQRRNDNDLDRLFNMTTRANSEPRQRPQNFDFTSDQRTSQAFGNEGQQRRPPPSTVKKVPSTTNIDDWTSLFAPSAAQDEFQEIEGETPDRRRARLERHERTMERAAKALADKNQRDLDMQFEQAEKQRAGEVLDTEIRRWAAGKEGNLRALLSTLQYVLWPECGWQPISLTDIISAIAVKKAYRKATLCVHPDKVQQKGATVQQKYIAEKVFDLLKEAWNKFNSEELF